MSELCKKCSEEREWVPTLIDKLKKGLKSIVYYEGNERIVAMGKNICYNLQYIQYLEKTLREIHMTSVIEKQTCKTYIITCVGIIEALFYYLIVKNGLINTCEWSVVKTVKSSLFKLDNNEYKTETSYLKRNLNVEEMDPTLDSMIKKVEKRNLTTLDHSIFPKLKNHRHLRNRIHLQCVLHAQDTDYNVFSKQDCYEIREILYLLLTSDEICPTVENKKIFDFLC